MAELIDGVADGAIFCGLVMILVGVVKVSLG